MGDDAIIEELKRRLAEAQSALRARNDGEAKPHTALGALQDSVLREDEENRRALLGAIDEGVSTIELIFDDAGRPVDFVLLDHNPALTRMTGVTSAEIGRRASEVFPSLDPLWLDTYGRVARTGEAVRFEYRRRGDDGRCFEVYASRLGRDGSPRVIVVYSDITERKRAEEALRESEEELRHTVELNPQISWTAAPDGNLDFSSERWAAWTGDHGLGQDWHKVQHPDDFPEVYGKWMHSIRTGEPVDVEHRAWMARTRTYRWMRSRAYPRRDAEGRIVKWYGMTEDVHDAKLAEQALRKSEQRFAQFAASSSEGMWIRDADTLEMEYASPAIQAIYGVPPEALLGDPRRWAALILPEDRDAALGHLEQARRGEPVVHEFRIQRPSDRTFRWIRNTDFPLRDDAGRVQRIGGLAADVTEAKLSAEHQAVLLAELQHRVRNIMAVIRSINARTGELAQSVPEYAAVMAGRLLTLARVQTLLTRAANVGVGIRTIVQDELSAQALNDAQYVIEGREVVLSPKAAEVLTLAIHELTTNAVKYGALSTPAGRVAVRWTTFERREASWLAFDWTEEGAPAQAAPGPSGPRRRGFGSELIEKRIPYELNGRGRVTIGPGGARCNLEFPLQERASILETDAPRRGSVFGGALDMAGEADLAGHRVLVVEDDYYLATDTARALRGAGAEVLGPCPSEQAALDELEREAPAAAVVDINLGDGPSFALARALKARGIPFVFITGYDDDVIPPEFEGVERLQKPVNLRDIVAGMARALGLAG